MYANHLVGVEGHSEECHPVEWTGCAKLRPVEPEWARSQNQEYQEAAIKLAAPGEAAIESAAPTYS